MRLRLNDFHDGLNIWAKEVHEGMKIFDGDGTGLQAR
jgi:hypothetical protein